MNHSDILDKIANIYTLRNGNRNYTLALLIMSIIILVGYLHMMFRKMTLQYDELYTFVKTNHNNKVNKPLLWT